MTWSLRLGTNAEWLAKVARQQGKQFSCLIDAPTLTLTEHFFFDAFKVLTQSRIPTGFGVSPIMLTEMLACADVQGLTTMEERQEFIRYMRAMDGAYLQHVSTKDTVSNG